MIVVTGLRAEARIARAPGVSVFACGGNVELRAHAIKKAVFAGAPAIVSFGIAGGLSSRLKPGDWIVATGVMTHDRRIETDIEWSNRLVNRLSDPDLGDIVSVADPVFHPVHKRRLRARTGASAVDMESFQAALLAEELGVPFAAVRVIADPAHRELPIAAMLGFQANGAVAFGAVAQSLFWNPSQIPSLMRLASDAVIAFRALLRGRGTLGPHFGSSPCTELESRSSATAIENPAPLCA